MIEPPKITNSSAQTTLDVDVKEVILEICIEHTQMIINPQFIPIPNSTLLNVHRNPRIAMEDYHLLFLDKLQCHKRTIPQKKQHLKKKTYIDGINLPFPGKWVVYHCFSHMIGW